MQTLVIRGGNILLPEGAFQRDDLSLADGAIAGIRDAGGGMAFDAEGLLVLPGIVDIHGDAFERQIQPRPGVEFPIPLALADTEAQLLANGITTAFHGITLSWEPGLRSLRTWRALLAALKARAWTCDMRVHLRWEAYNLDALADALADIRDGSVHLLAFNDHTPAILRRCDDPATAAKYSERGGVSIEEFRKLAARIADFAPSVPEGLRSIGAAAREAGIPIASHDDATTAMRDEFRARGARICEFPMAKEVAESARAAGDWVVMGSPNVVRGGSHLGWASAAVLAEAGLCNVLSSDYFYPAMLRAAFVLAQRGTLDLTRAWALISTNPAAAAGLSDRGAISAGRRADLVLVDPEGPSVVATIAGGRIAHLTRDGAARLR
ncbi:MAG: alpha-D-ribose 1-methylphosphonate 5-triphosphate diphosphatase [Proteobacteria bacterium]|nr:alpha-D-ribose 1-methylphosphonate 5-triphosphate diphosphatase [Pseudomonadota bacterium]